MFLKYSSPNWGDIPWDVTKLRPFFFHIYVNNVDAEMAGVVICLVDETKVDRISNMMLMGQK